MVEKSAGRRPTAEEVRAEEQARLRAFEAAGGLDGPVYALSPGMAAFDLGPMARALARFGADLERLKRPGGSATGYVTGNGYYDAPDADALYLLMRDLRPARVVEIGAGNSTRITRQAILDGAFSCHLSVVDPWPRADIDGLYDQFRQSRLETLETAFFADLQAGDVLFIDSSHQVRMSNDVAHLFCRVIPELPSGVVIHVHDVFLPYEYPKRFFYDCPSWGEQYMLHALLSSGGYEVLWPGYWLQRGVPEAQQALPFLAEGRAQSFWMRKR